MQITEEQILACMEEKPQTFDELFTKVIKKYSGFRLEDWQEKAFLAGWKPPGNFWPEEEENSFGYHARHLIAKQKIIVTLDWKLRKPVKDIK